MVFLFSNQYFLAIPKWLPSLSSLWYEHSKKQAVNFNQTHRRWQGLLAMFYGGLSDLTGWAYPLVNIWLYVVADWWWEHILSGMMKVFFHLPHCCHIKTFTCCDIWVNRNGRLGDRKGVRKRSSGLCRAYRTLNWMGVIGYLFYFKKLIDFSIGN